MGHRASIALDLRQAFGLSYPITYKIAFSDEISSGLACEYRHSLFDAWAALPDISTVTDGESGVRFDYVTGHAYVTVNFDHETTSLDVFFRLVDALGSEITTSFEEVCHYYDDREMPVVVTWDDWDGSYHPYFISAVQACRARGLWCSTGLNPSGVAAHSGDAISTAQWAAIQDEIDAGYLEVNNHSNQHRHAVTWPGYTSDPEGTAISEVDGSIALIDGNLTLPWQSRFVDDQFVLGHIEPHGSTNAAIQARLAINGLINQRRSTAITAYDYVPFDDTLDVFGRANVTSDLDLSSEVDLFNRFDATLAGNGVYHLYGHPWLVSGEPQSWLDPGEEYDWSDPEHYRLKFLDYIGGRSDVWYVAWGHLYAYRHAALNATVATGPSGGNPARIGNPGVQAVSSIRILGVERSVVEIAQPS